MVMTVEHVAELISLSPGWCRVALTAGNEGLRTAAAAEIAAIIIKRQDEPLPCYDPDQMALPL